MDWVILLGRKSNEMSKEDNYRINMLEGNYVYNHYWLR